MSKLRRQTDSQSLMMRTRTTFRAPLRKILFQSIILRPVVVDHLACGHKAERRYKKTNVQMRFCGKCWGKQK